MPQHTMIHWDRDEDGVVVLTLDDPDHTVNTMNQAYIDAMDAALGRLEAERDRLTGVVLTSAKRSFFAGGDVDFMSSARPEDVESLTEVCHTLKSQLRRLETFGRPVVAALNGAALGGGYEVALAAHHRIALDVQDSRIGLPEVTLGLLPGAGGVSRTVRLLGVEDALRDVLLSGRTYPPREALAKGLVHELAASHEELLAAARRWLAAQPQAAQPWDTAGFQLPGGSPAHPQLAARLPALTANLRKQLGGADLPAPRNILAAAVESAQVDIDTGFRIETGYLVELMAGQVSTNMMQAFFYDLQHLRAGGNRPAGHPRHTARRAAVVGAGARGAGLAYSCARHGLEVVLRDVSQQAAARGKARVERLLTEAVDRGRLSRRQAEEALARVTPSTDAAELADCDLVIEAVEEDPERKRHVLKELHEAVAPDALLASSTSTLPLTDLVRDLQRPENFLGLHFVSFVGTAQLVEIVAGAETAEATVAKGVDVVRQLGKTPLVVHDGRGFFTSRTLAAFLDEAAALLGEGVHPASIEQAGAQAGYATPPLRLLDEVGLTLPRTLRAAAHAFALDADGACQPRGCERVLTRMTDEFGRTGRAAGAGFYAYDDGRRTRLWSGLHAHFTVPAGELAASAQRPEHAVPFADLQERMLFAQALQAVHCLDEGVLRSAPEANIGSLLGLGFPAWTGGVLQYINGYADGPRGFVSRARELGQRYGSRFEPPASLVARAEREERYG